MPLMRGSTNDVIGKNIAELIRSYRKTGKIGNVTPMNEGHAMKMAEAIAYSKAKRK